jgi:hypothetical protein
VAHDPHISHSPHNRDVSDDGKFLEHPLGIGL